MAAMTMLLELFVEYFGTISLWDTPRPCLLFCPCCRDETAAAIQLRLRWWEHRENLQRRPAAAGEVGEKEGEQAWEVSSFCRTGEEEEDSLY